MVDNEKKNNNSDKFVLVNGAWVLLSLDISSSSMVWQQPFAHPRGKPALAEMISRPQKPPVFLFFPKNILSCGLVRK